MPFPLSSRTPSGPRRRTLLAAAAGTFALAGCSAADPSGDTTGGSRPSAADRARARAARDSTALAGRYAAVIAAHPDLGKKLAPLRADVVGHARVFGAGKAGSSASAPGTASPSASGSPTASPSGSASASTSASASASASTSSDVAARPKDALTELATAELALADERTQALVELPGELARLLASVAAAGAAHAFLLTEAAK
ncbi:hypothetical protein ACFV99_38670 [Streptomyces sp. NPDC059944]|uniref:hypothetical protein n=1 Tax=unclassified Streptomyces TaxID=2593676 RepID=UPI00365F4330